MLASLKKQLSSNPKRGAYGWHNRDEWTQRLSSIVVFVVATWSSHRNIRTSS
jgi:hypothetical protein